MKAQLIAVYWHIFYLFHEKLVSYILYNYELLDQIQLNEASFESPFKPTFFPKFASFLLFFYPLHK